MQKTAGFKFLEPLARAKQSLDAKFKRPGNYYNLLVKIQTSRELMKSVARMR